MVYSALAVIATYNCTNKIFLFFAKSSFGYKVRKETSFPEELCCCQYFGKIIKIKNTTKKHKPYPNG